MTHSFDIVVDKQGELRGLNEPQLHALQLGECVYIERSSCVDTLLDLPYVAQRRVLELAQFNGACFEYLRLYPERRFDWWSWIPALDRVYGPYKDRESAIIAEKEILTRTGLPLRYERSTDD